MRGNHDLKSALAAVVEARALAGAARKDYLPSGALQVKAEAMQSAQIEADPYRQDLPRPPSQRLLSAGQMFSWELDLFGRIGTAAAMADRKADAAAADARSAAAVLQAEVAKNYFLLRMDQISLSSLEREVGLSEARGGTCGRIRTCRAGGAGGGNRYPAAGGQGRIGGSCGPLADRAG
ncbi:hypothetical protein G6F60_013896 [Rhizopus arrhizus]|nr:hypothetical protein G6F60_013896 [Rhizopus arrhizus]